MPMDYWEIVRSSKANKGKIKWNSIASNNASNKKFIRGLVVLRSKRHRSDIRVSYFSKLAKGGQKHASLKKMGPGRTRVIYVLYYYIWYLKYNRRNLTFCFQCIKFIYFFSVLWIFRSKRTSNYFINIRNKPIT